jgi:hypothetical protein
MYHRKHIFFMDTLSPLPCFPAETAGARACGCRVMIAVQSSYVFAEACTISDADQR